MSLESAECFVCGIAFIKRRKNATCCSPECAKRKEVLRELERRKEKRLTDPEWRSREREANKAIRDKNKESERNRMRKWRSLNPEKLKVQRDMYKNRHPQKIKDRKKRYRDTHPEQQVASYLKHQLGFTPPLELIEEATALRLLRRSIKNAGE